MIGTVLTAFASSSGFNPIPQPVVEEMEAAANKFNFACVDTDDSTSYDDADDSVQSSSVHAAGDGVQLSYDDGMDTTFDAADSSVQSSCDGIDDASFDDAADSSIQSSYGEFGTYGSWRYFDNDDNNSWVIREEEEEEAIVKSIIKLFNESKNKVIHIVGNVQTDGGKKLFKETVVKGSANLKEAISSTVNIQCSSPTESEPDFHPLLVFIQKQQHFNTKPENNLSNIMDLYDDDDYADDDEDLDGLNVVLGYEVELLDYYQMQDPNDVGIRNDDETVLDDVEISDEALPLMQQEQRWASRKLHYIHQARNKLKQD